MPASRRDSKAIRTHRRENSSPTSDASSSIDDCTTPTTSSVSNGLFTEEQLKLRAMIPAITPAHGPESTSTAILSALSLGSHRPNSHTRRKSDGHVNRPPNAFIVFRRAQVQNMPANVTQHQQRISNLTALFWRVLTHSEQKTWFALADDIKKLHGILFPDYNFNPRNPDGSKKPMLPRAGITPERLDYAWNEAQLLIQRHTVMIDHPAAPPASCSGKLPRPKAPRKGQGTRAKERREREAAERAAAAVAATAQEAANGDNDDLIYSTGHLTVNSLDNRGYFAPIEEEPAVTPPSDAAIAWRPDFSLEGSVSSRSSPSNSWSELVSGSEANNELVDPLDTSYASGCYDANNAINGPTIVEDYSFGHFVGSFPSFTGNSPQVHAETTSISHAYSDLSLAPPPIAQKRDDAFGSAPKYATISTNGPVTTYASYYDHHHHHHHHSSLHSSAAANAVMAPTTEFAPHQTEAQYIFHDIDPTTTYLTNVDGFAPVAPANYVW